MKSIRVENFAGLAECSTDTFSSVESFPPVNYEFLSGKTYGIISDFGCGGWGLANAITGNGRWETQSKVYIDKRLSTKEELKLLSGNVLDPIWYNFFDDKSKCTVHNCIEYALFASHQKYTHSEIKDIFCLSNVRIGNKSLDNIILLFSRFDLAVKLFFGFRCRYNIYTVAVILSYNKLLILVGKANLYYACKRHCFTYRPSAIRSIDY